MGVSMINGTELTKSNMNELIRSSFEISPIIIFTYLSFETQNSIFIIPAFFAILIYTFANAYKTRVNIVFRMKYPNMTKQSFYEIGSQYSKFVMRDPIIKLLFITAFMIYISSGLAILLHSDLRYSSILIVYISMAIIYYIVNSIIVLGIGYVYRKDISKRVAKSFK